jgi:hypothetical protein
LIDFYLDGLEDEIKQQINMMSSIPDTLQGLQEKAIEFYHKFRKERHQQEGIITARNLWNKESRVGKT